MKKRKVTSNAHQGKVLKHLVLKMSYLTSLKLIKKIYNLDQNNKWLVKHKRVNRIRRMFVHKLRYFIAVELMTKENPAV